MLNRFDEHLADERNEHGNRREHCKRTLRVNYRCGWGTSPFVARY
jgi:hypothetical protein